MSEELDIEINGNDLDRTHGIAVAETREMVSRELLLPNISAMPPELILIPIWKNEREKISNNWKSNI